MDSRRVLKIESPSHPYQSKERKKIRRKEGKTHPEDNRLHHQLEDMYDQPKQQNTSAGGRK